MELLIEKLVPGGDGLARFEGKVVFVPGTLPGEKVRARFRESKKDFARAEVLEILAASPHRITPPCPAAGRCGGCDWQHIEYEEQLRQKKAMVLDALRRTAGFEWSALFPDRPLVIEPGKPLGYRNRIQLHRDAAGRAGFLGRASHDLVSVSECPVAHPALNALLRGSATTNAPGRFPAWAHTEAAASGIPGGDVLISGRDGVTREITVTLLGRVIRFDLRCFFQSNLDMLAKLIPFALEGAEGKEAMDLYCGVGLFGAYLTESFTRVLAVEENATALGYARRNIGSGKSGPDNPGSEPHVFLSGRLEELLAKRNAQLLQAAPDLVVVDPPRTGLDASVRDFLAARKPPKIIYVSCNPVTLARDLKSLLAGGFVLDDLRLFDFYPQTAHVEAVAKLSAR